MTTPNPTLLELFNKSDVVEAQLAGDRLVLVGDPEFIDECKVLVLNLKTMKTEKKSYDDLEDMALFICAECGHLYPIGNRAKTWQEGKRIYSVCVICDEAEEV